MALPPELDPRRDARAGSAAFHRGTPVHRREQRVDLPDGWTAAAPPGTAAVTRDRGRAPGRPPPGAAAVAAPVAVSSAASGAGGARPAVVVTESARRGIVREALRCPSPNGSPFDPRPRGGFRRARPSAAHSTSESATCFSGDEERVDLDAARRRAPPGGAR